MNRPTRLRDDPAAPGELRALIGRGRWSRPLSSEQRSRSAARLDRLVALPLAAGLLFWVKGIAIAAGLGASVLTAVYVLPSLRGAGPRDALPHVAAVPSDAPAARPRSLSRDPAPPVDASTLARSAAPPQGAAPGTTSRETAASGTGHTVAVPAPISASGIRSEPSFSARPRTSVGDVDTLAREAAMLEEARALLDRAPGDALSKLDEHAAAFPSGHLVLEREMMAVDALRRLGRTDDARSRGRALLARYHGSLYEERVRAMLEALPPSP
jgi:hypothetical protein